MTQIATLASVELDGLTASLGGETPRIRIAQKVRTDLTDGQLVTRALNGDQASFAILLSRHERKLRAVIRRRVFQADDADDLLQDAIVSAWAHLQTYATSRPFEQWIVAIAVNKCRDWGRSAAVRQRNAVYLPDLEPPPSPMPDAGLARREMCEQVQRAVFAMPATLREILTLTLVEEQPHKVVAHRLGVTPKAVETRLRRAKMWMREALAEA